MSDFETLPHCMIYLQRPERGIFFSKNLKVAQIHHTNTKATKVWTSVSGVNMILICIHVCVYTHEDMDFGQCNFFFHCCG